MSTALSLIFVFLKLIISCTAICSKGNGVCVLKFQSCLCLKELSNSPCEAQWGEKMKSGSPSLQRGLVLLQDVFILLLLFLFGLRFPIILILNRDCGEFVHYSHPWEVL